MTVSSEVFWDTHIHVHLLLHYENMWTLRIWHKILPLLSVQFPSENCEQFNLLYMYMLLYLYNDFTHWFSSYCFALYRPVIFRNVLNSIGLQRTLSFYYNSMAMLVTFFLSRILVIPILVYMLITVIGTEGYSRQSVAGQILMWMSHIILDPLNIRWFYKIIRSVRRMINTWHTDKSGVSGKNQARLASDRNGQVYWQITWIVCSTKQPKYSLSSYTQYKYLLALIFAFWLRAGSSL